MSELVPIPPTMPTGEWVVNGWTIRIDQGRKHDDDRRIWVSSPGGEPSLLSLATLGAIARLWYRNEDVLYPPADGYDGGEKVLDFLRECCRSNLETACLVHKLRPPSVQRTIDREAA